MALYMNQNHDRSKLQERIEAELREKAKKRAETEAGRPDGVADSQFVKGTSQTSHRLGLWLVLGIVMIVLGLLIVYL